MRQDFVERFCAAFSIRVPAENPMRLFFLTLSSLLLSAVAMNGAALAGENPQPGNGTSLVTANTQLDGNSQVDGGEYDTKTIVQARGQLETRDFAELRNQVGTSMMITWLVPEGSKVKEGDLIVQFDDSMLKTEADKNKLIAINSRADLLDSESALIRDRQAIARLPNMDQLQLKVMIEEAEIRQIQAGQQATIIFDALPDQVFESKVVHVTTYASPTSLGGTTGRQYEVTVSLDKRPDRVQLGMTANVEIGTADE